MIFFRNFIKKRDKTYRIEKKKVSPCGVAPFSIVFTGWPILKIKEKKHHHKGHFDESRIFLKDLVVASCGADLTGVGGNFRTGSDCSNNHIRFLQVSFYGTPTCI